MKKFSVFILSFILAFSFASQPVMAMKRRKTSVAKLDKIPYDMFEGEISKYLEPSTFISKLSPLSKYFNSMILKIIKEKCTDWTVPIFYSKNTIKKTVPVFALNIETNKSEKVGHKSSFEHGLEILQNSSTHCLVQLIICYPLEKGEAEKIIKCLGDRIEGKGITVPESVRKLKKSVRFALGRSLTYLLKKLNNLEIGLKKIIICAEIYNSLYSGDFLEELDLQAPNLKELTLSNFSFGNRSLGGLDRKLDYFCGIKFEKLKIFRISNQIEKLFDSKKFVETIKHSLEVLSLRPPFKHGSYFKKLDNVALCKKLKNLTIKTYFNPIASMKKIFSSCSLVELILDRCRELNLKELFENFPETIKSLTVFSYFSLQDFPEAAKQRLQNLESLTLIGLAMQKDYRGSDYFSMNENVINTYECSRCSKADLILGLSRLKNLKHLGLINSVCLVRDDRTGIDDYMALLLDLENLRTLLIKISKRDDEYHCRDDIQKFRNYCMFKISSGLTDEEILGHTQT